MYITRHSREVGLEGFYGHKTTKRLLSWVYFDCNTYSRTCNRGIVPCAIYMYMLLTHPANVATNVCVFSTTSNILTVLSEEHVASRLP